MSLFKVYSFSTIGPRGKNEDCCRVEHSANSLLACLADGVGGNKCGDVASQYTVSRFFEELKVNSEINLTDSLLSIHNEIKQKGDNDIKCSGMATTFTGCVITNNLARIIHVGDSRLYWLRGNGIKQLTQDHTEVAELLRRGKLTKEEALVYPRRNILQSAIGTEKAPSLQEITFEGIVGDRILISSDGFYEVFSKLKLRDVSLQFKKFEMFTQTIVKQLMSSKLNDNSSFIAIEIL
ncbi:PP2C family protein-serine/threonine phosphatase [Pedobacter agri]|uniref:PP2C family protein-serine/threonine phosphatase n=1 Tax=Pedobacter agri TaxID=454586 RepID=UPI00292EB738|nr:protein phosphatase 2C domain-containing protein [Pedobacter agri]